MYSYLRTSADNVDMCQATLSTPWVEKYRPESLCDVIAHTDIVTTRMYMMLPVHVYKCGSLTRPLAYWAIVHLSAHLVYESFCVRMCICLCMLAAASPAGAVICTACIHPQHTQSTHHSHLPQPQGYVLRDMHLSTPRLNTHLGAQWTGLCPTTNCHTCCCMDRLELARRRLRWHWQKRFLALNTRV